MGIYGGKGLGLLYVTGDMHGDIERFKDPGFKKLKKGDSVIVCGDFGFVWDGSREEKKRLEWIGKRKYNVLFIEGCHDNYNLLAEYETVEWNGGKVRQISGNLMQLCRGEIFTLEGKKLLAFGGGDSDDHDVRLVDETWWAAEEPTVQETHATIERMEAIGDTVDYIITHDVPATIKYFLNMEDREKAFIHAFFDMMSEQYTYQTWFFGKYHLDRVITPHFRAVFREVAPVEPVQKKR